MTRNLTGGKNHKKAKQGCEKPIFIEKQTDQQYARVVQVLGNRNILAYCNDNIVRLCHIRGSIRKDMWISKGDLILVSLRDFLLDKDDKFEKGDILYKYDRELHSVLRKEDNINIRLFLTLETKSLEQLKTFGGQKIELADSDLFDDDLFEENEDDEEMDINAI